MRMLYVSIALHIKRITSCGAKVAVGPKCGHHVTAATIVGLLFPPQLSYVALETDCVAGHVGLELPNPRERYPFEVPR